MANDEHVEIVRKGAEAILAWRDEHPGEELDLRKANLRAANLRTANLSGADLYGAKLSAADLSEVRCGYTTFADVNLAVATGLETIQHEGPSTIGIDTLFKSQGKIPEVFLRGCGVPESFISYVPSFTNQPIELFSCFISYSHEDKSFARRLHDSLQGRGVRCWLDEHQLRAGDDIYQGVDEGIKLWDKVLLCASKDSLTSWWVDREIDTAIEKEMKLQKKRGKQTLSLIPLNLDGYFFEWDGSHAAALRKRLAPDFTEWEGDNAKFEDGFEKVVKALRADDGGREPPPKPKL